MNFDRAQPFYVRATRILRAEGFRLSRSGGRELREVIRRGLDAAPELTESDLTDRLTRLVLALMAQANARGTQEIGDDLVRAAYAKCKFWPFC